MFNSENFLNPNSTILHPNLFRGCHRSAKIYVAYVNFGIDIM